MIRNKMMQVCATLNSEADRYRELAKTLALEVLQKPDDHKARLVREHMIRSETFRTAASLAEHTEGGQNEECP